MLKVSVVIPIYNVEKYLHECLNSVINQTLKDIEIICVDDGSTDTSVDILREYASNDARFILLRQENQGAGVARNFGMSVAKGKYVYFMDSDDYCDVNLLEKCFIQAEKINADVVVFDFCRFEDKSNKKIFCNGMNTSYVNNIEAFSYVDCPDRICSIVIPTPWNKFFRLDFLKENNLVYLPLSTTNDITFATLTVMLANKISYVNETLYFYRIGEFENITSKKRKNLDNIIKAVLKVDEVARNLPNYNILKKSIRIFVINNLFVGLERYAGAEDTAYCIEYRKQMEALFYSYPLFLGIVPEDIENNELFKKIETYRKRAQLRNDRRYLPKIILSMTSFPDRVSTVHKAIASLFEQSYPEFRIILWLSEQQFPNKTDDLPAKLLEFVNFGLEIMWCKDDLKPHKKYYYAMKSYPKSIVVTFDDDLIYDIESVSVLVDSYMKYPMAVSTLRAHLITIDNNEIATYANWIKESDYIVGYPSMQLFSTSGAGTLYPPNCMNNMVFEKDLIKETCLNADDIWLKIMQVLSGTPVVLARENKKLRYIDGTQEFALQNNNVLKNENDIQLRRVINLCEARENRSMSWFVEKIKENDNKNKNFNKKFYVVKRIVLCIPKKFCNMIHYYREHGLVDTVKKIVEKFIGVIS